MTPILSGLRVVEVSAFIAAPLGGMTLAQLGADVIRIDPLGGNIDYKRWPLAPNGDSLYWASLNKSKRSVSLALDTPAGRELAAAIITAPGKDSGILLTNLPASGWMDYRTLSTKRSDLIMVRLLGNSDGTGAVDYTVNCASGFPVATGFDARPINHVLPAWDIAAGLYLSTGLLAAERQRQRTGKGQEVTLSLADVMLATVGNLGYLADVQINQHVRPPIGNDLYGALGRDFETADGRSVMIAVFSNRQWQALGRATGLSDAFAELGADRNIDLTDEGGRFDARSQIFPILENWVSQRSLSEIAKAFEASGVLWGPYQDFGQLVHEDARCSAANPLFGTITQSSVEGVLAPGTPLFFGEGSRLAPAAAPTIGQDTKEVLSEILGLTDAAIGKLREAGTISAI